NTDDKFVHNFFPDGDIEAAISLIKRLQAKINDIALIVGKENNILDPNENDVLERAGVETETTIGEIQVEEIEDSLRHSREVSDYNELDDTSKNPILQDAGSDEAAAFERIRLRRQLFEEFDLEPEDFSFAKEYFDSPPEERELLRTCYEYFEGTRRPGVFGLAHVWLDDEDKNPPLGRTDHIIFHAPFGGDVGTVDKVRSFGITPEVSEAGIENDERVRDGLEAVRERVEERLEGFEEAQVEGAFKQGAKKSKTQEMLIEYLGVLHQSEGVDRAGDLRSQLKSVGLKNTDEDRVLREEFRDDDEAISEWDVDELLDEVEEFIDEYIEESTEYQTTLAGSSSVEAELMCWGIIK
ncbi:MAG: helicase SNF2, partial [Halobacteria archaeon]|nr:helicase SNF2 [Halobacteria archaeon]